MHRTLQAVAALAAFMGCVGCSMCQSPYDYCAPTVYANGQPTGGFLTRQGSVLGGTPGVPYVPNAQQPTPAPAAGASSTAEAKSPRAAAGAPTEAIPTSATLPVSADEAESAE